ncbi:MAG: 3-dehydroquinate synthase [Candidatus Margulisbacteria bacterium]|nr:3-dehydroquinate synthase [Candidatus Margulisiibacteriota bacterium]MBU1617109.1 3-dehydroquinate synthase [Candidatus Margulisiibacteriota bacterium]
MKMEIKSKVKDYSAEIVSDLLDNKDQVFSGQKYDRLFYFIDEGFYRAHQKKVNAFTGEAYRLVIPALEQNKSYLKLADYYRALIDAHFTRNDILVTFGGGILQDISGFIASTMYRGLKWIFFPTTLLAQADSCIGSKTSINFDDSKNLIGTFYPPDKIFIDRSLCRTLADAYFNSGLGEIIKFHLMSNQQGYALLKKYLSAGDLRDNEYFEPVIRSTLEIKRSYFEGDEFDSGRRNLLNYGHCFGHALESASNFGVSHGEAVIVGMGFANLVSLKRGIMTKGKYDEFEAIFRQYYPKFDFKTIGAEAMIKYLKKDKKRVGHDLTMILSKDIGQQFKYDDLKEDEFRKTYAEFIAGYRAGGR